MSLTKDLSKKYNTPIEFVQEILQQKVRSDLNIRKLNLNEFQKSVTASEYKQTIYALNTNNRGENLISWFYDIGILKESDQWALDIGSGYGGLVKAFIASGLNAHGIEISDRYVKTSKLNLNSNNKRIVQGDILDENNMLNTLNFDFITCIDVIEHVHNPEKLIYKIWKYLNQSGRFLVRVPNYRSIENVVGDIHHRIFGKQLLNYSAARRSHEYDFPGKSYTIGEFYSLGWYKNKLEKIGFKKVRKIRPFTTETYGENFCIESVIKIFQKLKDLENSDNYDWILKEEIKQKSYAFLADFLPNFSKWYSKGDDSFSETFIEPVWYITGEK